MTHSALWSKRVRACPDRIGIWKCWFLRRGKNRRTRREPWGENQEQTQLAYGIRSNPDRTTLVGGECSHHCATFASLHRLAARISLPFYDFLQVFGVGWVRNIRPKPGKGTGARGLDLWYFHRFPGLRRWDFFSAEISAPSKVILWFKHSVESVLNTVVDIIVSYWFFAETLFVLVV